mmetsp:Transcript_4540/g.17172  ORF Transcript_4540/g.17172 Transcript_4540/m.17172 type:complete len:190 (-) Transcript_4540:48-617(-)
MSSSLLSASPFCRTLGAAKRLSHHSLFYKPTAPASYINNQHRSYARVVTKKKKVTKQLEKFPRAFRKYNVYGLSVEESKRPRPPMTFTLPRVPEQFYKLRYFIFQLAQCKLTYDWEHALQIARQIQRYQGSPGMPEKVNPVVFNWICIALIRCKRPVEAIEIWRGMRNRDNGIYGAAIRELRKQKLTLK